MTRYILHRLAQLIPVLLLATVIVFLAMHLAPGGLAVTIAGPDATPAQIAKVSALLGLNKPLWEQYGTWLGHAVQGNFGHSFISGGPALTLIAQRIPATAELAIGSLVIALVLGTTLGVAAALRAGRLLDRLISAGTGLAVAIPAFWLGILGLLLFAVKLRWVPIGGYVPIWDNVGSGLRALILPAAVLASDQVAILARFVRASMTEALATDYVRLARAKGLAPLTVVVRHALRSSLTQVITVLGLYVGRMMGGAVIIETVFAWPGVGRLLAQAAQSRDYAVVQGILVLLAAWCVVINLLTDLAYGWGDPRIRVGRGGER